MSASPQATDLAMADVPGLLLGLMKARSGMQIQVHLMLWQTLDERAAIHMHHWHARANSCLPCSSSSRPCSLAHFLKVLMFCSIL